VKTGKKWRVKSLYLCHEICLDSLFQLFQKTPVNTKKNELVSQEMLLKISLLSRALELSDFEPDCRISAFNYFAKKVRPMAF
jgi:hypothetical protein